MRFAASFFAFTAVALAFAGTTPATAELVRTAVAERELADLCTALMCEYGADTLHVASELGSHRSIDLGALHRDYCVLMREVWKHASAVWAEGRPVTREPPAGHVCR